MIIGAELDKQIYKEGEPTWGCKQGDLDVEDVMDKIKEGDKIFLSKYYGDDNISNCEYDNAVKLWEEFKELLGEKLTGFNSKTSGGERRSQT